MLLYYVSEYWMDDTFYVSFMFDDPVLTFRHTISVLLSEPFDFTDPSYYLYAELVECGFFLNLK